MTQYVNLHVLQPFSYANPNRDDTGAPKSAIYGGVLRGRISSQSWKRAIRLATERALDLRSYRAAPTTLAPMLAERAAKLLPDADRKDLTVAAWVLIASFTTDKPNQKDALAAVGDDAAGGSQSSADDKKETLSWFTDSDLARLAELIAQEWPDVEPLTKNKTGSSVAEHLRRKGGPLQELVDGGFGPTEITVAAFGRMYANATGAAVDAAVQVAHALTTHEMSHQVDYFTAVDDARQEKGDSQGAGHLGLAQFTGGVYYRYLSINVDDLRDNAYSVDPTTLRALLESMILALPSGKQNATANHEAPLAVLAEVHDRSLSYASAFEKPVPPDDAGERSAKALFEFADRVNVMLGADGRRLVTTIQPELVPAGFERHDQLGSLIGELVSLW